MKSKKRKQKPDYYIKRNLNKVLIFDNSQKRNNYNKHLAIITVPYDEGFSKQPRRTEKEAIEIAEKIVRLLKKDDKTKANEL